MGGGDRSVIRVVVVDDDEILLHGIHRWLAGTGPGADANCDGPPVRVIATAKSVTDLLSRRPPGGMRPVGVGSVPAGPAVVALLDLRLGDGRRVTDNVKSLIDAGYAVVTCGTIDDAGLVYEAARAGALGYVRKARDPRDMRRALAAAAHGERYLSQGHAAPNERDEQLRVPELSGQEREALRLYASGLTMSSVARRLNVKQGTAKSYLDRVRDKYELAGRPARTKLELRDRALEDGVLHSPRPGGPAARAYPRSAPG